MQKLKLLDSMKIVPPSKPLYLPSIFSGLSKQMYPLGIQMQGARRSKGGPIKDSLGVGSFKFFIFAFLAVEKRWSKET
jgi:hypothetical protein